VRLDERYGFTGGLEVRRILRRLGEQRRKTGRCG
jgi:hypothetical protein